MSSRLEDRLKTERRRRFVGWAAERDLFWSAITPVELPFNVLHVFGPGGAGKTTLLDEFIRLCDQAGISATCVDARNIEPSPDSFLSAVWLALGLDTHDSPFQVLASRPERRVLIDNYETLAPLDAWMSETFLPQLPENLLLVLASRNPPPANWRVDQGWQTLVRPRVIKACRTCSKRAPTGSTPTTIGQRKRES